MIHLRVSPNSGQFASFSFFLEVAWTQQSKGKILAHGTDIEGPNSYNMYSLGFVTQPHLVFSSVLLVRTDYYDCLIAFG